MKFKIDITSIMLFFSSFLTAAHFLRFGETLYVAIYIALPFLSFMRSKFIFYVVEIALGFSVFIWIKTAYNVIIYRISYSIPFVRFSIILSVVIAFIAFTAYFIWKKRDKYNLN